MAKIEAGLLEIYEELRKSNRLNVLLLIASGIHQKDIAAALGISTASVSIMFPKGVLKNVARLAKNRVNEED